MHARPPRGPRLARRPRRGLRPRLRRHRPLLPRHADAAGGSPGVAGAMLEHLESATYGTATDADDVGYSRPLAQDRGPVGVDEGEDMSTETRLSIDRPGTASALGPPALVVEGWAWTPEGDPQLTVTVGGPPGRGRAGPVATGRQRRARDRSARGYLRHVSSRTCRPGRRDRRHRDRPRTARGPAAPHRRGDLRSGADVRPTAAVGGVHRAAGPEVAPGRLTHAEHVARYRWAAPLAVGRGPRRRLRRRLRARHPARRRRSCGSPASTHSPAAIIEAREQARDGARVPARRPASAPVRARVLRPTWSASRRSST